MRSRVANIGGLPPERVVVLVSGDGRKTATVKPLANAECDDVTDRRSLSRELENTKKFLELVVDNIPVMSAVLKMDPAMGHGQWMLVTLTAGTGGSMLSIGSAAGVALMGAAKMQDADGRYVSVYTFMGHLKWTWAVALGFAASIGVHLWINARYFAG